jgi:hypothetical protein
MRDLGEIGSSPPSAPARQQRVRRPGAGRKLLTDKDPTLVDRARGYAADGRAGSTKKAYLSDFRSFEVWCSSQGISAMPARPELVALYATALADVGRRVSTIERAVTAIAQLHRSQGIDWPRSHPALTEVLAGIRRRLGTAPAQKVHRSWRIVEGDPGG